MARHFLELSGWNLELARTNFHGSEHSKSNYKPTPKYSFKPTKHAPPQSGGITTLSSLKNSPTQDNKQQNYYAGGGQSGIQVTGPPQANNNPNDVVSNIF